MADADFRTVGIMSIGEMGLGVGKMLIAHKYRVVTFAEDRSESTRQRARSAGIELMDSVAGLVQQCDCMLSIVPPRDALETAQRIHAACPTGPGARKRPLYYLDLNAVSPGLASEVDALFQDSPNIVLIDGGIIGGVPHLKPKTDSGSGQQEEWHCPSLIVSGPTELPSPALSRLLNLQHLPLPIGAATGLKMCYASMTKGFLALAIQGFSAADALGVLPDLRACMRRYNPAALAMAESGVVAMPPKAYRWVREMQEIAATMEEEAGFDRDLFNAVGEVYRTVAEDTELGKETPGRRVRGKTVDDAVLLIREGIKAKKTKTE